MYVSALPLSHTPMLYFCLFVCLSVVVVVAVDFDRVLYTAHLAWNSLCDSPGAVVTDMEVLHPSPDTCFSLTVEQKWDFSWF